MQMIDDYARKGFRLMALAKGVLRRVPSSTWGGLTQEQLEGRVEHFTLLGLLVLNNELREDSAETISKLQLQ